MGHRRKKKKKPRKLERHWTCPLCGEHLEHDEPCGGCGARPAWPTGAARKHLGEGPLICLQGTAAGSGRPLKSGGGWQSTVSLTLPGGQQLEVQLHPSESRTLAGPDRRLAEGAEVQACGALEALFVEPRQQGHDDAYRQAPTQQWVLRARLLAVGQGADEELAQAVEQLVHPQRDERPRNERPATAQGEENAAVQEVPTEAVETPDGLMYQRQRGRDGREAVLLGGPRFDDFNVLYLAAPVMVLPPSIFLIIAPLMNRFRYDLLTYLGLGWLLGFLFCAAGAARSAYNRRVVRVDRDGLSLSERPIPWGGGGRIPASRIRKVTVQDKSVRLELTRGGERELLRKLDHEQAAFAQQVVAGELGLEPRTLAPRETRARDRVERRRLLGGALFTSLPVLFGLCTMCAPGCPYIFAHDVYTHAVEMANRCPLVTDRLGGTISWAAGFSHHSSDLFDDDDNRVSIKVRGSRGGGEVFARYGKRDDGSIYYNALYIRMLGEDGEPANIGLHSCVRAAEQRARGR